MSEPQHLSFKHIHRWSIGTMLRETLLIDWWMHNSWIFALSCGVQCLCSHIAGNMWSIKRSQREPVTQLHPSHWPPIKTNVNVTPLFVASFLLFPRHLHATSLSPRMMGFSACVSVGLYFSSRWGQTALFSEDWKQCYLIRSYLWVNSMGGFWRARKRGEREDHALLIINYYLLVMPFKIILGCQFIVKYNQQLNH